MNPSYLVWPRRNQMDLHWERIWLSIESRPPPKKKILISLPKMSNLFGDPFGTLVIDLKQRARPKYTPKGAIVHPMSCGPLATTLGYSAFHIEVTMTWKRLGSWNSWPQWRHEQLGDRIFVREHLLVRHRHGGWLGSWQQQISPKMKAESHKNLSLLNI